MTTPTPTLLRLRSETEQLASLQRREATESEREAIISVLAFLACEGNPTGRNEGRRILVLVLVSLLPDRWVAENYF